MPPMIGKMKFPTIAPKNPPIIDRNADVFLPPQSFTVNAESRNSIISNRRYTSKVINNIFLVIISKSLKNPNKKIKNDKTKESNINPMVIGSLRNLKLIYINKAEIETKSEEISKIFIVIASDLLRFNQLEGDTVYRACCLLFEV